MTSQQQDPDDVLRGTSSDDFNDIDTKGDGDASEKTQDEIKENRQGQPEEETEELRLAEEKLTNEDIAFVIKTMKTEAPHDEVSIKQLFCGMSSTFTKVPIPHTINSKDSGAGKSYLLNHVAEYFPNKYVLRLTGMSDKAIFHRPGILVRERNNDETGEVEVEPIDPIINDLELEIEELKEQIESGNKNKNLIRENKRRIKEIESEINDMKENAQKLINLDNQIILGLDTPPNSLLETLMTLMSQDSPGDQKYEFAEKSSSGKMGRRINRLRGMPVLFTTRVIDDSRALRFQEKNRRSINVTPVTSAKKIEAANNLIMLADGVLPEEYDMLVVSREDKERAKHIVKVLVAKLIIHSKYLPPKKSGIKNPFHFAVSKSIPLSEDQVWSMTVTERTKRYLSIITKLNMDSRPRILDVKTGQFWPITTFEDLKETLFLMERAASGIRPYLVKWVNWVFIIAFKDLNGKSNELQEDGVCIVKERHVGVTTEQLAEKTKEVFGGLKPSNTEVLYKYLYPLINQGIIDKVQSQIDGRQNIYFPVEELNIFSLFDDPDDPRLKVPSPDAYPTKSVIEESFRFLFDYNSNRGVGNIEKKYRLIDVDGKEITPSELVEKYFELPEACFVKGWYPPEEQAAISKNILYSAIIQQKHFLPPAWYYNQSGYTSNVIECNITTQKDKDDSIELPDSNTTTFIENKLPAVDDQRDSLFQCFYCSECFASDTERLKHRGLGHPGKLDYSEPEDFDNRLRPNRLDTKKVISTTDANSPSTDNFSVI